MQDAKMTGHQIARSGMPHAKCNKQAKKPEKSKLNLTKYKMPCNETNDILI